MQRDTTRHRFIAKLASHIGTVMDEAGIKHKKHREGGGQEVWWRCSLNALRIFVGTFVNRPLCRYNVAMIILCVCYAANTTSV